MYVSVLINVDYSSVYDFFVSANVILEFAIADSNLRSQPVQGKISGAARPPRDADGMFIWT